MSVIPNVTDERLREHFGVRTVTPRPDCLIWAGTTDSGYGRVHVAGKNYRAHRVAWELANGAIPDGLTIDHLCRVRACVNPDHMELVDALENNRRSLPYRDKLAAGPKRRRDASPPAPKTHCRRGHEYTPENTYVRPSDGCRRCRTCIRQNEEARPLRDKSKYRRPKTPVAAA